MKYISTMYETAIHEINQTRKYTHTCIHTHNNQQLRNTRLTHKAMVDDLVPWFSSMVDTDIKTITKNWILSFGVSLFNNINFGSNDDEYLMKAAKVGGKCTWDHKCTHKIQVQGWDWLSTMSTDIPHLA